MHFTFGTLVLATILVILSITTAVPIITEEVVLPSQAPHTFNPDGPHQFIDGSRLVIAGTEVRGLVPVSELHGHTKGSGLSVAGSDLFPRSFNTNDHGCPKE